jgi:hypothetical protein
MLARPSLLLLLTDIFLQYPHTTRLYENGDENVRVSYRPFGTKRSMPVSEICAP